ncbi:hypothetical protein VRY54_01750 [Actinomyces sp. F1_1611]
MEGIKVAKVAIGTSGNALAVAEDGTLWGWGKYMGPGFSDIGSARQIDFPEFSGKKVIAAAATANSFTVALDDATTWSWGVNSASNNNGQYGVGTNTWSSTPVQLPALNGKQIVRLEGSMDPNNNMFALDADGGLWGWGYNGLRILGDGSSANKNAPVQPVGFAGKKIVDFDAYQGHMVAVDDEGSLWGWGNQLNAVFGNGWTGGSSFFSTPQKLTQWGDNFVAVSVGSQHTIAVTADGKLYAAGSNGYGQLGNGSNASNLAPQLVEGLDSVKILDTDAGQYSSYAMSNDGRVYAFGRGDSGQIGDDKIPLTASALLPVETLAPELQFTKVQFDGIEGTSLTNLGDARATVVTPAHPAGPVDVQVSMTLGGTPIEPDTVLVDGFTYIADIPPSDLVHPEDVTVVEGEAASFSADATAAPGTGPLSVQWQQSTDDGLTWTDIPDAHSTTYSIAATTLSQSGNRYRAVFSTVDDEASSTTNSALLTVTPTPMAPPTDIVDPVDQTVTEGEAASFSADATAAPGTGPLSVQWQQSTDDGLTWTDISGATGLTYTTPATTMSDDGMKFRALFTTVDGLTTVNTGAALLTVLPFVPTPMAPPTDIVDPVDQTVTEGEAASFSADATAAPGTGPLSVQWQQSTDDGLTWTDISGATGLTYTTPATTMSDDGMKFRALFTTVDGLTTVNTGAALLTVLPFVPTPMAPPTDIVDPVDQTVTEGEAASFSADATAAPGTGPLSVQWQQSTDDGLTWTDISGATGLTYTTPATTMSDDGMKFRALFTTVDGLTTVNTGAALLTVLPFVPTPMAPPTDIVDPVDQTVTEGEAASFSADATAAPGTGPLSVQWQQSTDDGLTWTDISGATGLTYTTPATTMSDDGMKFRALFTTVDGLTTVNTGAALLTVLPFVPTPMAPPTDIVDPVDQTVTEGEAASFSADATAAPGTGPLSVQWQQSTDDGLTWTDISGATGLTYTTPATTMSDDGMKFRALFTTVDGLTTVNTGAALLTVLPFVPTPMAPPTDIVDPVDQTVTEGEAASFSADATAAPGTGPLSVQWQQSTDDGLTWTDISGATGLTYTTPATTMSDDGMKFRALFTTVDGLTTVNTGAALLTVLPFVPTPMAPPTDIVDPVDQTVTEGEAASFSADATAAPGTGPLSVQWQQSTDDGLTWTDISGATGLTYTTPATTMSDDGMKFRALFTTVDGLTTVNTGAALLTVLPFVPTPPPLPELPNNVVQPQPIPKELANTGTVWVENSIWLSLVALVLGILAHIAGMRRKVKRM